MNRSALFIALMTTACSISAAPWTYRGSLQDAGKPANGQYDLRLTLLGENGSQALTKPVTVFNVQVKDGNFAAEVDFGVDLSNAPVGLLKTEIAHGSGFVALGEPVRFDAKSTLAGICWDTEGNAGTLATTNFVGNTDNQTLVLSSPRGVSVNRRAQIINGFTDLLVFPSSGQDADADLGIESTNGNRGNIFMGNSTGTFNFTNSVGRMEFFDGVSAAIQNGGNPMFTFSGRMLSRAVGVNPGDTGGGLWFDGASSLESYVGRGANSENVTGFFAGNAWRLRVNDDGYIGINTATLGASPDFGDTELVIKNAVAGTNPDLALMATNNFGAGMSYVPAEGKLALSTIDASITPALNTPRIEVRTFGGVSTYALGRNGTQLDVDAGLQVGLFGVPGSKGNGAYLSAGGAWTNRSSRLVKHAFDAINPTEVLGKVLALPLSSWEYNGSSEGRHLGPVAEDFHAAFGLGHDDKSIASVDADGVALAAIQGLNAKLETENRELRARLDAIEARLVD